VIRVVTVGREFGSGGAQVAAGLARSLGWKLIDNALIKEIAQAAKVHQELVERCDERVDPWFHHLMKGLWHGGYEGVATTSTISLFDSDVMAALARNVIEQAAGIGRCVIVGRGGQCILQGRDDVFHVFIYAPWEEKVERVRKRTANDVDAETLIIERDRARSAYIRRYFDQEWLDCHLYHLMISSSLGEAALTATILEAIRARERSS
jgi:cytidylate kinase